MLAEITLNLAVHPGSLVLKRVSGFRVRAATKSEAIRGQEVRVANFEWFCIRNLSVGNFDLTRVLN